MEPLILVVDDDDRSRKLIRDFLTFSGFRVAEACDGNECLLGVVRQRPDLILLDMQMPGLDGIATLHRLRENQETMSVPIIMLSASVLPDEKGKMRAAGCDAILDKPVDLDALLLMVRRQLQA